MFHAMLPAISWASRARAPNFAIPLPEKKWEMPASCGVNDKTVIRAGFSRVYDRAGFALLNTSDQVGAAGLTTTL